MVAIVGGLFVGWITTSLSRWGTPRSKYLSTAVVLIVFSQFFIGIVNIYLLTPLSVQVIHLLVADLLWITYILWWAALLGERTPLPVRHETIA